MTWPAAQVKTNVDAAGDDPKLARSDFAANVDKFNQLQAHVSSFGQSLIDDADAATARATLGLGTAALKNTGTSGDALGLLNASVDFSNAFLLSGAITAAQITANTNNYAPTNFANAMHVRTSSDASRNITGLAGGAKGRLILFANVGSFDIVLTNQDAASTAANRFLFAGGDKTLTPNESVLLRYDGTTSRWRAAGDVIITGGGGTPQTFKNFTAATTSTFSGLDAGLTRITGHIEGATFGSGTDRFEIRIGDSGGIDATGYVGRTSQGGNVGHNTGFVLHDDNANTNVWDVTFILTRREDHIWHIMSSANRASGTVANGNGRHALTTALTDVQLTTFGGKTMTASGGWNITVE